MRTHCWPEVDTNVTHIKKYYTFSEQQVSQNNKFPSLQKDLQDIQYINNATGGVVNTYSSSVLQ